MTDTAAHGWSRAALARWLAVGLWLVLALPPHAAQAAGGLAGRVVVVDPGHGGGDPGAIANGLQEKNLTLPIGLDVGALLTQQGAQVVYTRTSDATVGPAADPRAGLATRAAIANSAHANIFISIHANALNDPGYSGLLTFYGADQGYIDGVTRTPLVEGQSRLLARAIHGAILQRTQETDRGVWPATFYVLGNTTMPSILVETGFLTNASEAQRLATPSFQQTVAAGIADGVAAFFAAVGTTAHQATDANGGRFVADLSFPDHSTVEPGQSIVKTWRIANNGTTTWSGAYRLLLQAGGDLPATASVALPPLPPGGVTTLSASATVPAAPGDYSATWRLTAADGLPFGDPLWLAVTVPAAPFNTYWVQTTQATTLWDDSDSHADAVARLGQWSYLQVSGPQAGSRLPVTDPAGRRQGYVDAQAVGPSGSPPPGDTSPDPGANSAAAAPTSASATPNPAAPPPSPPAAYQVRPGDTLSGLAQRFHVDAAALAQANGLANPNLLVAGRTLRLPAAAPAFQPFWVENFMPTPLWSDATAAQKLAVAALWTPMQVLAPATSGRYRVRLATTGSIAYVAGDAVGPAGPPPGAQ